MCFGSCKRNGSASGPRPATPRCQRPFLGHSRPALCARQQARAGERGWFPLKTQPRLQYPKWDSPDKTLLYERSLTLQLTLLLISCISHKTTQPITNLLLGRVRCSGLLLKTGTTQNVFDATKPTAGRTGGFTDGLPFSERKRQVLSRRLSDG